jgi:hypothetical protein
MLVINKPTYQGELSPVTSSLCICEFQVLYHSIRSVSLRGCFVVPPRNDNSGDNSINNSLNQLNQLTHTLK